MNEMSPSEIDTTFWDIVVSLAARDEYIKNQIKFLHDDDLYSLSIADDYYDNMKRYLANNYGLTDGLYDHVFDECEANIVEEKLCIKRVVTMNDKDV